MLPLTIQRSLATPIGTLVIEASAIGVVSARFASDFDCDSNTQTCSAHADEQAFLNAEAHAHAATTQLAAYFAGSRTRFELRLAPPSGTAFQQRVWDQLLAVPYGQTTSYARIASDLGVPSGSRAVGLANGANPLAILIPCHRVIGKNGDLTGYAAGIERKRWLLELERDAHATLFD